MDQRIEVYDVTLRDGTQSKDVNLTVHDKLEMVKLLDDLGVDYIELGWLSSNPKDKECFSKVSSLSLKNAKIAVFGSTRRKNNRTEELEEMANSGADVCTIFGKTIKSHVVKQLGYSLKENLHCIKESVSFLKDNGMMVFYDAEHFFDGFKDDPKYALDCLKVAVDANAEIIILCDTNGGCLPHEIKDIVKQVKIFMQKEGLRVPLGIHAHNDSGCGVANTVNAVLGGATQVQVSVNGIGERCGNADLCQVVPNLELKLKLNTGVKLEKLTNISNTFNTLANIRTNYNQPYVGKNAFSHKGGVHVDAIRKGASYEHIDPSRVGNKRDIILSDLSGKANILEVAQNFGIKIRDKNDPRVEAMLEEVKRMEKEGYNIGESEGEKKLLVYRYSQGGKESIEIERWKIMSEFRQNQEFSECVMRGKIEGREEETVASSHEGPVNAAFIAMRKLVGSKYKEIDNVKLINYKVMIAEDKGPASSVRVYIEFENGKDSWSTVGVSSNILEASLEAIKKSFEYFLIKMKEGKENG